MSSAPDISFTIFVPSELIELTLSTSEVAFPDASCFTSILEPCPL